MTEKGVETKKSEEIKKIRRKIEDKLRKDLSDKKIVGLANLLDIETEPQDTKKWIKMQL